MQCLRDPTLKSIDFPSRDQPTVLRFKFYHSYNADVDSPTKLSKSTDLSTELRFNVTSGPDNVRNFPNHRTIVIYDERKPTTAHPDGVPLVKNAIVVLHAWASRNIPRVTGPPPGTVNQGYNLELDEPRPQTLDKFLTSYDLLFIIDDSYSMDGQKWEDVKHALKELADIAGQLNAAGIEVAFLNSPTRRKMIKDGSELLQIFPTSPNGGTPTGARLKVHLEEVLSRLDAAVNRPEYAQIKPLHIVVLTDGIPDCDPLVVLEEAARKFDSAKHHPNCVRVQFVQIGDDHGAKEALERLTKGNVRNMVDTYPYNRNLTPEQLQRILLGKSESPIRAENTTAPTGRRSNVGPTIFSM